MEKLYKHQAQAVRFIRNGQDVVLVTPTASGKTLCYNLPVLQSILDEPETRALYLFPTKALAQDQMHEAHSLITDLQADIKTFTYDGDTPDDARQAASLGVAGLLVSNHGGRTLDTTPATATMLPRVAQAVGGQLMLIVDGGIRRGTDVFKALALGADAVMVGRPYVYALAAAGALGVAHAIRLLRDELEIAMALSGCATLDQITPDALIPTAHSA